MKTVYDKIEDVLKMGESIGFPALAPHEFIDVGINGEWGHRYVGCSESALGRRLREMRKDGRVMSFTPDGKSFKRYTLVKDAPKAAV